MKKLVAVTIAYLLSTVFLAQSSVSIELTSLTSNRCEVTLVPSEQETNTLSGVVFTLKWRATRNIALGNPQANPLITISKSGPVRTSGGWKYQLYSGCGLVSGQLQTIVLNIPRSGRGDITISNDEFVQQIAINGQYFVSIGGREATGQIWTTQSKAAASDQITDSDQQAVIMYYDPSSSQFFVKREGVYYTMVGQRVAVRNEQDLIVVRKRD